MVRNRVTRRLRAIMADELARLPQGSKVVVRALPDAAATPFLDLKRDVASAVDRARIKADA